MYVHTYIRTYVRTHIHINIRMYKRLTHGHIEGDLVSRAHGVAPHLVPTVVAQSEQTVIGRLVEDLSIIVGWLSGQVRVLVC